MRYLSVCSGIEAASVAWHPLGWEAAAFSEIEPFPRAVLQQRWPDVPLHGDFTTIQGDEYGAIDLLVGGTPCQSFSIAGLRGGLADERGNLALEFIRLAARARPRWVAWENVPGVLSSNGGRDFGAFIGALEEVGYGWAYRTLDAQYFGVPQRRRRVFVVGYLGDWRRAAAVLFERHSLSGDSPPRREKGQSAPTIPSRSSAGGGLGTDFDCDGGLVTFDRQSSGARDYKGPSDLIAFGWQNSPSQGLSDSEHITPTLDKSKTPAVAFADCFNGQLTGDVAPTMGTRGSSINSSGPTLMQRSAVRRLTPRECERLQGFPDDYTLIPYRGKPAADGPRYKALGNSMAVPVVRWVGRRLQFVDGMPAAKAA